MSQFVKSLIVVSSSCFLILAFQNCGQPGSVSAATDLSKSQGPLVVDVVGEMQNQQPPAAVVPPATARHERDRHNDRRDDRRDRHDDHDDDGYDHDDDGYDHDEVRYDYELEEILNRYACDERASSRGSNSKKIMICHYPPGNASARHELCISRNALNAHLNHGHGSQAHQDHLGKCEDEVEE